MKRGLGLKTHRPRLRELKMFTPCLRAHLPSPPLTLMGPLCSPTSVRPLSSTATTPVTTFLYFTHATALAIAHKSWQWQRLAARGLSCVGLSLSLTAESLAMLTISVEAKADNMSSPVKLELLRQRLTAVCLVFLSLRQRLTAQIV